MLWREKHSWTSIENTMKSLDALSSINFLQARFLTLKSNPNGNLLSKKAVAPLLLIAVEPELSNSLIKTTKTPRDTANRPDLLQSNTGHRRRSIPLAGNIQQLPRFTGEGMWTTPSQTFPSEPYATAVVVRHPLLSARGGAAWVDLHLDFLGDACQRAFTMTITEGNSQGIGVLGLCAWIIMPGRVLIRSWIGTGGDFFPVRRSGLLAQYFREVLTPELGPKGRSLAPIFFAVKEFCLLSQDP
jgi:hypothetical protein